MEYLCDTGDDDDEWLLFYSGVAIDQTPNCEHELVMNI